jgi:hypothetical protein
MPTSYTDSKTIYTLQANGPVFFGAFSVVLAQQPGFGYAETDIDAAIQAFTDALNASGHERIDTVVKVTEATGTSDWTYQVA